MVTLFRVLLCLIKLINFLESSTFPEYEFRSMEPVFRTSGTVYEFPMGGTGLLECAVENLGDNTIVWKQGERVISAGSVKVRKDVRMSLVKTHYSLNNLEIRDLKLSDAGNYTCEVEWQGQPRDITHLLRILQPPVISQPHNGANIFVNQGEDLKLACTADGDPRPKIRWKKDEKGYLNELRSKSDHNYLLLYKVNPLDKGKYICQADNRVAMDYVTIHIHVNYPPKVEVKQHTVHSGVGAKVEFECIVEGYPQPVVNWYRHSENQVRNIITQDERHVLSTEGVHHHLHLRSVSLVDLRSNFTCRAGNEQGTTEVQIQLTGIPEPPSINSSPESMFSTSYQLVFTVKSFTPILQVEIKYRPKAELPGLHINWFTKLFTPKFDETERKKYGNSFASNIFRVVNYSLDFLDKSTDYEVSVKVENEFGWSDDSNLFQFRTREKDYKQDYQRGYFNLGFSSSGIQSRSLLPSTIPLLLIFYPGWM